MGVAIAATATFLVVPPFRSEAQKSKRVTIQNEDGDSTTGKRKSVTVDRNGRTFRLENGDLEKTMAELEKAMAQLEKQDFANIEATVQNALKAVDMEQIQRTVEQALKSVNMDQIKLEVEQAMKSVDMKKIQLEVEKAMKEVDMDKIKAETSKALKEVDWKNIQEEVNQAMKEAKITMEEAGHVNMDELKKEMENAKKEIEESKAGMKEELLKAKGQLQKAKVQLQQMKEMLTEMENDGLIKKGEKLNINWKNGKLIINGKEQPQSVTDKYKKYIDLDINSNGDDDEI